jgi:hypothetical protein
MGVNETGQNRATLDINRLIGLRHRSRTANPGNKTVFNNNCRVAKFTE